MIRPVDNPPSRFASTHTEWDEPLPAGIAFYEDHSREILSRNDSPDLHFRWSVNPYRGCFHGCAYCYARPSHEYLGFGAGTDFERKIVYKPGAPALLEAALRASTWQRELILFSGNTDCYQPVEARLGLTRACLEVCARLDNPVGIITKSALVARDAELISRIPHASVAVSIPFHDPVACRDIEPGAPPPARRYEAIAALAAAGVRVGVNIAPVIPGLTDRDIPSILAAARAAGARHARLMPVRLPGPVEAIFRDTLQSRQPLRARGILERIRRLRGGSLNDARFGHRFEGQGEEWAATLALFRTLRARHGFDEAGPSVPGPQPRQASLFPETLTPARAGE